MMVYENEMPAPVTLRLGQKTRERIGRIARRNNVSASDVIRQAIDAWVGQQEKIGSPYEMIADLLGIVRGGDSQRSSKTGKRFAEILKKRRSRG